MQTLYTRNLRLLPSVWLSVSCRVKPSPSDSPLSRLPSPANLQSRRILHTSKRLPARTRLFGDEPCAGLLCLHSPCFPASPVGLCAAVFGLRKPLVAYPRPLGYVTAASLAKPSATIPAATSHPIRYSISPSIVWVHGCCTYFPSGPGNCASPTSNTDFRPPSEAASRPRRPLRWRLFRSSSRSYVDSMLSLSSGKRYIYSASSVVSKFTFANYLHHRGKPGVIPPCRAVFLARGRVPRANTSTPQKAGKLTGTMSSNCKTRSGPSRLNLASIQMRMATIPPLART